VEPTIVGAISRLAVAVPVVIRVARGSGVSPIVADSDKDLVSKLYSPPANFAIV